MRSDIAAAESSRAAELCRVSSRAVLADGGVKNGPRLPLSAETIFVCTNRLRQHGARLDPRMSAAPAAGLFSAGQRVRVSDGVASFRRALLLCLHAEGCDVEFEGTDEEESNVPLSRVAPLLDFEVGCARGATASRTDAEDALPAPARAEQHKQQGNQLFKLRDHAAAAEEYAAGLRALRLQVSTGARCLVKPVDGGSKVRGAMVTFLDEDAATADLLYEATSRPLQP